MESDFSRLMLVTQATGTQVQAFCLAVDVDSSGMYIRRPAAVGVTLGMADIMTELRRFTA